MALLFIVIFHMVHGNNSADVPLRYSVCADTAAIIVPWTVFELHRTEDKDFLTSFTALSISQDVWQDFKASHKSLCKNGKIIIVFVLLLYQYNSD